MVIGTRNVMSLHRAGSLRNLKDESEEVPALVNGLAASPFCKRPNKNGFQSLEKNT
jgi:hypothetical protein